MEKREPHTNQILEVTRNLGERRKFIIIISKKKNGEKAGQWQMKAVKTMAIWNL